MNTEDGNVNADEEIARRNLIQFRQDAALSQSEAADVSGVSLATINSYESGRRGLPRLSNIKRLMDAFGRNFGDLFLESPPPLAQAVVRPFSLRVLRGVPIPEELEQRARAAINEANQEYQRLKASGQLVKKDGGDGGE